MDDVNRELLMSWLDSDSPRVHIMVLGVQILTNEGIHKAFDAGLLEVGYDNSMLIEVKGDDILETKKRIKMLVEMSLI